MLLPPRASARLPMARLAHSLFGRGLSKVFWTGGGLVVAVWIPSGFARTRRNQLKIPSGSFILEILAHLVRGVLATGVGELTGYPSKDDFAVI